MHVPRGDLDAINFKRRFYSVTVLVPMGGRGLEPGEALALRAVWAGLFTVVRALRFWGNPRCCLRLRSGQGARAAK